MSFNEEQAVRLVTVPGTPYVRLEQDENMKRVVEQQGTIVCERHIAALPEVRALGPNDLVLDVGAFIGDTAIIFADRGAKVYAFEPQVDAFCAALINCRGRSNITVLNTAVGNGEPVMPNQDPIAGNLGTRTVRRDHAGPIAIRLSDLPLPLFGVTFIKIDVEGFEPAVINGAMELIAINRPILLIEIYPELLARQGWTATDVTAPLLELGYTIREAIGNSTEPRWDILCTPPRK